VLVVRILLCPKANERIYKEKRGMLPNTPTSETEDIRRLATFSSRRPTTTPEYEAEGRHQRVKTGFV